MTASNTKTQSFHSRNLCCLTWPSALGLDSDVGAVVGFEQNTIKKRDVLQ